MKFNLDSFLVDLGDYCRHHKISNAKLAEYLGVSRTHLSLVRNGRRNPSPLLVKSILNLMKRQYHDYRII